MLLYRGILSAIEVLLDSDYASVRTLGAELICQITELNQQPSVVREHILKSVRAPNVGVNIGVSNEHVNPFILQSSNESSGRHRIRILFNPIQSAIRFLSNPFRS